MTALACPRCGGFLPGQTFPWHSVTPPPMCQCASVLCCGHHCYHHHCCGHLPRPPWTVTSNTTVPYQQFQQPYMGSGNAPNKPENAE